MGDIIKIRRVLQARSKESPLNSSLSSLSETGSVDITPDSKKSPTQSELNTQAPNATEHLKSDGCYSSEELLAKPTPRTKCTKAQIYFRNLIRDCARQAKIWDKAYTLPSIPDGKCNKFFELIGTAAPQLEGHRADVKARLAIALQNKRKYQLDLKLGKRKRKNGNKGT